MDPRQPRHAGNILYELALTYQPAHPDLVLRRKAQALKFAGQITSEHQREEMRASILFSVVGLVILGAVIRYVLQKRRKSKGSKPLGD